MAVAEALRNSSPAMAGRALMRQLEPDALAAEITRQLESFTDSFGRAPDFVDGQPPYQRLLPLYSTDRPDVHGIVAGLRGVIDEFPERLLIGEIYLPLERVMDYYGVNLDEVHLPFNFQLIDAAWNARDLTWDNAPANDVSGSGVEPGKAVKLGSFTMPHSIASISEKSLIEIGRAHV